MLRAGTLAPNQRNVRLCFFLMTPTSLYKDTQATLLGRVIRKQLLSRGSCEKGGQWQLAMKLFYNMTVHQVYPDVIAFSAAISSCEKGGQWKLALQIFQAMLPDAFGTVLDSGLVRILFCSTVIVISEPHTESPVLGEVPKYAQTPKGSM